VQRKLTIFPALLLAQYWPYVRAENLTVLSRNMTKKNSLKPAVRRIAWRPTTPIPKTLSVTISKRKRE